MIESPQWYDGIRAIHDLHFSDEWQGRVDGLNQRLTRPQDFMLPHRAYPPPWFNGDIERLEPGRWVLVVSLNPHIDASDATLHGQKFTEQGWWDYWRCFNMGERWKGAFFPRLARLAAACLGEELLDTNIKRFATKRMLFIEFCPYASPSFSSVPWLKVKQIAQDDVGFRCTRDIRQAIFAAGRPALVLANGKFAAYDVKDWQCPDAREVEIARPEAPDVKLKVWTSWFATDGYRFPVVGFNQLGRRNSHATAEADLIARFVREQDVLLRFEDR